MPIPWNDSMATGVTSVDNEHKELFRQANALHVAMTKGKGTEEIGKLIDFLSDYVIRHFRDEERRMDEMKCPAAAANRAAHAKFLENFNGLCRQFKEKGASSYLVLAISNTLTEWLAQHIAKIDKQMSACIAKV